MAEGVTTPIYQYVIAGSFAGFSEYMFRQPFDLYKVVRQTNCKHCLPYTRGMVASLTGAVVRNGLMFSAYNTTRDATGSALLAGLFSGVSNGLNFQFVDIVKVKQQTRRDGASVYQIVRGILQKDGARGLCHGAPVTVLRECVACPIYYGLYDHCQAYFGDTTTWSTIVSGSVTGFVSFTVTHPIDVLKSNQQSSDARNLVDTWRHVRRQPFWWCRGIVPVWVSIVPATAICFLGYEYALRAMYHTN